MASGNQLFPPSAAAPPQLLFLSSPCQTLPTFCCREWGRKEFFQVAQSFRRRKEHHTEEVLFNISPASQFHISSNAEKRRNITFWFPLFSLSFPPLLCARKEKRLRRTYLRAESKTVPEGWVNQRHFCATSKKALPRNPQKYL